MDKSQSAARSIGPESPNIALLRRELQKEVDGTKSKDDSRISPLCYPGLRSFAPEEGEIFFGRDEACGEIQAILERRRTLTIIGGSGSGKSSLVRAGLLPFLNSTRRIAEREGRWFYAECRPGGNDPMTSLWSALESMLDRHFGKRDPTPPVSASAHVQRRERAEHNADRLDRVVAGLDALDARFRRGRSGPANLLLLIDQFEEVFRPSVPASLREELLDLLVVSHARTEKAALGDQGAPGLFVVLAIRSEEVHRCTEHSPLPDATFLPQGDATDDDNAVRSLTDVVNASGYFLRLLDMKEDRMDLRHAVLEPARKVLIDYEIPFDSRTDEPFAPDVIDWLLDGAGGIGGGMEHQADQMPLLQHALRQMWLTALLETDPASPPRQELGPSAAVHADESASETSNGTSIEREGVGPQASIDVRPRGEVDKLLIHKRHLFSASEPGDEMTRALARKAEESRSADVRRCLRDRARRTEAVAEARVRQAIGKDLKEAPLKAMCRALARRDDRGNWARRYASVSDIDAFLACDPAVQGCGDAERKTAIEATTEVFKREGLLHQSRESKLFDISHEALIRNWDKCREWLRPLVALGVALSSAVRHLGPFRDQPAQSNRADYLVSAQLADELAPLAQKKPAVPLHWATDELVELLWSGDARNEWGLTAAGELQKRVEEARGVLSAILALRNRAVRSRRYRSVLAVSTIFFAVLGLSGTVFLTWWVEEHARELALARAQIHELSIACRRLGCDQPPQ